MPMYALRHIVAAEMLANGIDIAAIAAQLGPIGYKMVRKMTLKNNIINKLCQ